MFAQVTSTFVQPTPHTVDNYGPNVQAVSFNYCGQVHTINRRGKRNVIGFTGSNGTYTLTNGTDKMLRMNNAKLQITAVHLTNGEVLTDTISVSYK